jgi:hypothetical protein
MNATRESARDANPNNASVGKSHALPWDLDARAPELFLDGLIRKSSRRILSQKVFLSDPRMLISSWASCRNTGGGAATNLPVNGERHSNLRDRMADRRSRRDGNGADGRAQRKDYGASEGVLIRHTDPPSSMILRHVTGGTR